MLGNGEFGKKLLVDDGLIVVFVLIVNKWIFDFFMVGVVKYEYIPDVADDVASYMESINKLMLVLLLSFVLSGCVIDGNNEGTLGNIFGTLKTTQKVANNHHSFLYSNPLLLFICCHFYLLLYLCLFMNHMRLVLH